MESKIPGMYVRFTPLDANILFLVIISSLAVRGTHGSHQV